MLKSKSKYFYERILILLTKSIRSPFSFIVKLFKWVACVSFSFNHNPEHHKSPMADAISHAFCPLANYFILSCMLIKVVFISDVSLFQFRVSFSGLGKRNSFVID